MNQEMPVERLSARKRLYELDDVESAVESLKKGKLSGIGPDPANPEKDRIILSPPSMGSGVFLDLDKYLALLISRGYQVTEGIDELQKLSPFSKDIVLKKIDNKGK